MQYINAQFNVNNLLASSLTDLTLIAYQKTGNMGGTALKNVYNFGGSSIYATNDAAGIAFARAVKPVNAPSSVSPNFVVNNAGADLQLFSESELTPLQTAANTANELSTAGGEYLLPYGFVARNGGSSRVMNASTNNAGTVNIAIQVPTSNSSALTTGYRFTMTFVIFDAPVATRVSESLKEQGAGSGANTRKTSFGPQNCSRLAARACCPTQASNAVVWFGRRGTAASPLATLVDTFSLTTTPGINAGGVALTANLDLTLDRNGVTPTGTDWITRGNLTGKKAGAFSGGGSSTLTFNPTNDFRAGELVTTTLKSGGITTSPAANPCVPGAKTLQFRVATASSVNAAVNPKSDLTTGADPFTTLGDVNNDGILDLVTANYTGINVNVFLGNGGGGFAAPTTLAGVGGPTAVALGNLNNDGNLDIVTTNSSGHSVSVFLGTGTGSFGARTDFSLDVNSYPYTLEMADFNADGNLDVVTANGATSTSVSILLGNGSGGFAAFAPYTTGAQPYGVAVGDVNNDGKLDIVTANNGGGANSASILLGNGDGTFQAKTDVTTNTSPNAVALGDLNNDGNLDMVTSNASILSTPSGGNTISVLLGNGNGIFQAKTDFTIGATPIHIVLADMNGDGNLDAITTNYTDNTISIRTGLGNGSFNAVANFTTSTLPLNAALGDLNNDSKLDIVTGRYIGTAVNVFLHQ